MENTTMTKSQNDAGSIASVQLAAEAKQITDAALARLEQLLKSEGKNQWSIAEMYRSAHGTMSYTELSDWALARGYRQYNRTYIQHMVQAHVFLSVLPDVTAVPFTYGVDVTLAKNSLLSRCRKAKLPEPTITASDAVDAAKSAGRTRADIREALRNKFAPDLPEKVEEPAVEAPVGSLPLFEVNLDLLTDKPYRVVVAAKDEDAARRMIGAKVARKKGLGNAPTQMAEVGYIVTDKPMVLAIIPLAKNFTMGEVDKLAASVAE